MSDVARTLTLALLLSSAALLACGDDDASTDGGTSPDAAARPDASRDAELQPIESRYDGDGPARFGFCDAEAVTDLGSDPVVRTVVDTRGALDAARPSLSCSVASHAVASDAAFSYLPATDGILVVTAAGDGLDTLAYVRDGCAADGQELACDDDAGGRGGGSRLTLPVVAGTPLFIVVDGSTGVDAGEITLTVELVAEPTDSGAGAESCAAATELVFSGTGPTMMALGHGDTTGRSNESGCDAVPTTGMVPDEFFAFTLPDVRDVVIEVNPDTDFDPAIYVFDDCSGAVQHVCHDVVSVGSTETAFAPALPAGTYILGVDGFLTRALFMFAQGSYTVRVTASTPPGG